MADNGNAPVPKPTGCYKCGQTNHWSRDCTVSNSNQIPNSNPNPNISSSNPKLPFKNTKFPSKFPSNQEIPVENPKKVIRKVKPKLTPELLLSEDGLGYILRHFPKAFKCHNKRGHEVEDLGNLIELYTQWHSRFIPYYSFEQFIHKVEQVGATKRVRTCLRDLRDRVANGGDPSKLHEAPVEHNVGDVDPVTGEVRTDDPFANATQVPNNRAGTSSDSQITEEQRNIAPVSQAVDFDEAMEEEMLDEEIPDEIYAIATGEAYQPVENQLPVVQENPDDGNPASQIPDKAQENEASGPSVIQITEEQRARMEANRLKAAAARARARALSAD